MNYKLQTFFNRGLEFGVGLGVVVLFRVGEFTRDVLMFIGKFFVTGLIRQGNSSASALLGTRLNCDKGS